LTAFLIDLGLFITVAFCTWRGFKSGLIRGAFGIIAIIFSLVIANVVAQAYSNEARGLLMPFTSGVVESTMNEQRNEGIEYQELAYDHEFYDDADFGTAFLALRYIGFPEIAAVLIAESSLTREDDEFERTFSDVVAERVTERMSFIAVFGVAFLLMAIIFAIIGNLIGLVFSLPGLRLVDMIAGASLGFVKGVIIVYTIAVIVRYFGLLMVETLERTLLLSFLVNNNPIANMLGV